MNIGAGIALGMAIAENQKSGGQRMKKINASKPFSHCEYCNAIEAETMRAIGNGQAVVTWIVCSHRGICEEAEMARQREQEKRRAENETD